MRITIATASVLALAIACWRGQAREPLDQQRMAYKDGTTAEALDSEIITPNEIALGDSVFNGPDGSGICATCHGRNGVGIPGAAPSLSDSEWINGDGSIGFMSRIPSGTHSRCLDSVIRSPIGNGRRSRPTSTH
jgi:mono/diheme cytochrome c family protein